MSKPLLPCYCHQPIKDYYCRGKTYSLKVWFHINQIRNMASVEILSPLLFQIKIPRPQQLIYKDECVYSFDNPETETGLYVSLTSYLGYGRNYAEQYYQRTGNALFLHIFRERKPIPQEEQGDGPEKKITRLAIGVEGGFDPNCAKPKFEYTDHYSVVVLPEFISLPWPNNEFPEILKQSVQSIIQAESPMKLAELAALAGTWDGETRQVSKHADGLHQLNNGVRILPSGWKCANCDLTTNLWLNLTDGSILCGRKFFDGSGGNDHAVIHYRQTGYPLAVKLGTITSEGRADVYSYAEDDMVEDPFLVQHLRHFGINNQKLEKTEKSMVELELELNQRDSAWGAIQESDRALQPLHGPGLTGLVNLGNSCYLNSVMQVLFKIPDIVGGFVDSGLPIIDHFPADPVNDFNVQTAKLGVGLVSGKYSIPGEDGWQKGIAPHMFKNTVGRHHPEFSTKRQQDVQEFYLMFLNLMERNCRHRTNPAECLRFSVEERIQCTASSCVAYSSRVEKCLPLPIPLEATINRPQVEQWEAKRHAAEMSGQKLDPSLLVRPLIPFQACLEALMGEDEVEQFFSSAVNEMVIARKRTRLASFPDYLMIQLKKFTIMDDWTPAKLDVEVDMPWEMDLKELRGFGLRPDEQVLPEHKQEPPTPTFDAAVLAELADMGFPVEACKRALFFTKNSGLEPATNWIMEHMADDDFAYPFVPPGTQLASTAPLNPESVEGIKALGFTTSHAEKALRATGGDLTRAVDWIFSHSEELNDSPDAGTTQHEQTSCRDGSEKYKLVAFISHIGTSSFVGHYVCHALQDGRWVLYNDQKVALSEKPPKNLAYMYLYQRI